MATMTDCGSAAHELLSRLSTPVRNRYYFGKLLDAWHLELEQAYGNHKRWLVNRLSLGTGVLCGLEVTASADHSEVRVGPGVAIDGWGREIVVERNSPGVDPRQPTDECGRAVGPPARGRGQVTLWICYHECEAEPAPVLVSECERECENGLIRERYRLRITPGGPQLPELITTEQCQAIFSAAPDRASRRTKITETLAGRCPEPSETCVPLAVVELDREGKVVRIDPVRPRPMLYSNAMLLELILCLATRVDECCPPKTIKSLSIVKGNHQQGDAGQPLALPLVVFVGKGAAPVQGEQVTFTVLSGQGKIGDPPNPLGPSFQVNTASDGTATLPEWVLGAVPGSQSVTASIAAGAPSQVTFDALAREVRVDLPVINAMWPPPRITISRDPATVMMFDLLHKFQAIQLIFDRAMTPAQLDAPDSWLRLFGVIGVPNQYRVVRLPLRHATAAEAAQFQAAVGGFAPGTPEWFVSPTPPAAPISTTHLPATGSASMQALLNATPQMTGERGVRFLTLINADVATRDIVDQLTPAHLLDAEFQGSTVQLVPGGAAPTLWDEVWNVAPATLPVFGQNLWDAMSTPTTDVLPSGDGSEGGRFDSWFGFLRR
ncbi:MAG: hypothetical protein AB7S39_15105 [Gemmatimonadales bacterium]